jgi:HSP20 family protein
MIFTRLQSPNYQAVSPFHRVISLRDELHSLFQQALGQASETTFDPDQLLEGGLPPLDFYEDKDGSVVKIDLPGMKKEDIAISVEDGVLAISGERKQDPQLDAATVCRCERVLGRFERRVSLPCKADTGKVTASYTDGVLTVNLPKAEEAKQKQIPINIK